MRISEHAARERLREAMRKAGGQAAWRRHYGLPVSGWQVVISRSVTGPRPIRNELLLLIGIRRDQHGDIHEERDPVKLAFLAVHAPGQADNDTPRPALRLLG
ncbi:hypothetical protein [Methylobacterium sp. J-070]|uniref:hypothetical protein n=1 Tax=Methylobacterium sp. J-070 TaxID=2836650 RepID=UPI001FB97793|nr:hypothetical protein [Methylobacterium sp. J-070]MCJ2048797.1 hypothetical protein [Methylobacterium sp. J-070]